MLDADGLDDATMLAFAQETRLAETTFVQPAQDERADYRNRIWTVVQEVPFAGHPSLGTACAVALNRDVTAATYVQETHVGLQPITVARVEDRRYRASVLMNPVSIVPAPVERAVLFDAVGLDEGFADPELEPSLASAGLPTLIVPVADAGVVERARPDRELVANLPAPQGPFNLYLVAVTPDGEVRARCIPSYPDEMEDPATGSAAGPLLATLHAQAGMTGIRVVQGVEVGRRSVIDVELEDGRPRVSGDVLVLAAGEVWLPA